MTNQPQVPSGPERAMAHEDPILIPKPVSIPVLAPPTPASDGDDSSVPDSLPHDSSFAVADSSSDSPDAARLQSDPEHLRSHHQHSHSHAHAHSHSHHSLPSSHSHISTPQTSSDTWEDAVSEEEEIGQAKDQDRSNLELRDVHGERRDGGDDDDEKTEHHDSRRSHNKLTRDDGEHHDRVLHARQVVIPVDADADGQDDYYITQVIQTVSLVQVVDPAGNPIETQTVYAPPATIVVDPESGNTVAISAPGSSRTVAAAAASDGASPSPPAASSDNNDTASSPPFPTSQQSSTPVTLSTTTSSSSVSFPTNSVSLSNSLSEPSASGPTSILLPTTAIPGAPQNSSSTDILSSANSTSSSSFIVTVLSESGTSYTTTLSLSLTSSGGRSSLSSESSESFSFSTSTDTSFSYSSSVISTASSDFTGSETSTGGGSVPTSPPGTDSTGNEDSNDGGGGGDLTVEEKQIVGGVVGGVAGAAFILILVLLALRYKKKKHVQEIIGEGGTAARRLGSPGGGGNDSNQGGASAGAGAMTERPSFGVAAALATLSGKNTSQPAAPAGEERGFYRVSGRKLPSVLQAGGDGYTDPRESAMSGSSSYYRGSEAFDPVVGGSHHLALGSPMRPVSGIPVMRSGPARTPTTEQNPFADPPPPSPPAVPPPPLRDAIGRSLGSQDGSRGSGSRFQEAI